MIFEKFPIWIKEVLKKKFPPEIISF